MSISTITLAGNPVTVVQLPAAPGLRSIEWDYFDQVAAVTSMFTGQKQRQKWPGADMLSGVATMPPLTVAQADDWESFQMQLRGMANAFQMGDPLRTRPRGSGANFPNSPIVDNTVGNLNIAGSETLNTKGWVANSLVLRRGDWLQVGYRLYRALDDVTSDSGGHATIPIWPSLREQPSNNGTSASWINAAGAISKFRSVTLGGYGATATWSNFSGPIRGLPADAVIQGIYPVIVASATFDIAFQNLTYGNPAAPASTPPYGPSPFTNPFSTNPITPGASFSSTEFYGPSIGASLSVLAGQLVTITISSSLLVNPTTDAMAATGVGYAIYYTSAAPYTDPLMAPPFTVPSGQGLAWSVPLSAVATADPATGAASATPGLDNGNLLLANAKGLFALSSNRRTSSVNLPGISRTSFPFEEYR